MQDIIVAAIQMNAPLGEVERNRAEVVSWTRRAAAAGAELVVFPELVITGHWCAPGVWEVAEGVPDGPTSRALAEVAADLKVTICFGIAELERGIVYNSQVVVGPGGVIGKQRKLHLSRDEYFHYRAGTVTPVMDIGKCKLGIGICYDNMFPEVPRIAAVKGAEVYLMPHAARFGEWPQDEAALPAIVARHKELHARYFANRAYDNGMFVIDCNQAGQAGPGTNHAGGILIFDPGGGVIAESRAETVEDEMVVCELRAEAYVARRNESCFNLQTRRPEVYGELARMTE